MSDYILGSGKIYIAEYSGSEIPADAEIEVESNQFGFTKGGATLTYTPEYYTVEDDNGQVKEPVITKEEATLKCGSLLCKAEDVVKVCPTAKITTANKVTTVKVGGVENDNGKSYVIRFVHISGKLRATIIGKNTSGFELTFAQDSETVLEPTFTATPMDSTGVLAQID